jgi:hypothetical protein
VRGRHAARAAVAADGFEKLVANAAGGGFEAFARTAPGSQLPGRGDQRHAERVSEVGGACSPLCRAAIHTVIEVGGDQAELPGGCEAGKAP